MSMEITIHVRACPFPCEQCHQQGDNYSVESVLHTWVLCQRCLDALLAEGNQIAEYHFSLDLPSARFSEFQPGAIVSYEMAGQRRQGEILYILENERGQLVIIENQEAGFPDVVRAWEVFGKE